MASRLDDQARLVVEAVEIYRGTPSKPVSLIHVEDRIVTIAALLGTRRVVMDRWQAALLGERLGARGLSVTLKTSDAANLDRWATALKRWFAERAVVIPNHAELIEQLEGLEGEELRRRDRVRFTATGHHRDDAAIALCLSAEGNSDRVGQRRMAEIDECLVAAHFGEAPDCYLWVPFGRPPSDPVCRHCAANTSTQQAHQAYLVRTAEAIDLRTFAQSGLITANAFVQRRVLRRHMTRIGLM